jgi:hypothetical protein
MDEDFVEVTRGYHLAMRYATYRRAKARFYHRRCQVIDAQIGESRKNRTLDV